MGLRNVLFGRKKLAEPKDDRLFALSTATVTLDTELGLKPAGQAAVIFKPLSSGDFNRTDTDVEQLLKAAAALGGLRDRAEDRQLGYEWVIIHDPQIEDQVTAVHLVASELTAQGFGGQLLAAAFKFDGGPNPVYWIYGFKTRHVLAVHPERGRQEPRQRHRARAEGEARGGASGRAGPDALARPVRRADLDGRQG